MKEHTFPVRNFSHPSSNYAFSNCLSHSNPANGRPYKIRSRGTTGASIVSHDLGHLYRGRRIQTSGHSDLGIWSNLGASSNLTWVWADTASAACPSQPSYLAITSMIFCNRHLGRRRALFSKNCVDSRVVFYNVSRCKTLPFHFCNFGFNSAFFEWHMSINVAKWTFLLSLCASWITSFLLLTFTKSHAAIVSSFLRQLLHPESSSLVALE